MQFTLTQTYRIVLLLICSSIISSKVYSYGEQLIPENIPQGVSHELFGKVTRTKNLTSAEMSFAPNPYKVTRAWTNNTFPLNVKKTDSQTIVGSFDLGLYPSGTLPANAFYDLTNYNGVEFIVENLSVTPVTFYILPYDNQSSDTPKFWTYFTIPAHSGPKRILSTLDDTTIYKCTLQNGMQRCPVGPNQIPATMQTKSGVGDIDRGKITHYRFRFENMPFNGEFKIHSMKALHITYRPTDIPGFIDQFGQNRWLDFPGKVKSVQDLKNDAAQESPVLLPVDPRYDIYGGDKSAGGYPTSGFFSVTKSNGKWWFVSPLGNLMYIKGLNWVSQYNWRTTVRNREILFHQLPPETAGSYTANVYFPSSTCPKTNNNLDGVGEFCGGKQWSPYMYNILTKYYDTTKPFNINEVLGKWGINLQNRLRDWGFNTAETGGPLPAYHSTPYPMLIGVSNFSAIKRVPGTNMPDVYDSTYEQNFKTIVTTFLVDRKVNGISMIHDPTLIGLFSDNELDFGHMFTNVATIVKDLSSTNVLLVPAKQVMVNKLKTQYGSIAELRSAWAQPLTGLNNIDEIATKSVVLSGNFVPVLYEDLMTLVGYYKPKEVYYLIIHILGLDGTSPSKQKLIEQLRAIYPQFSNLKNAWSQPLEGIASWQDMASKPVVLTGDYYTVPLINDFSTLLSLFAEKYYSSAKRILKEVDSNHLFLGTRFAFPHRAPKEAIDMCAEYCDVMTVNNYHEGLSEIDFGYLLTRDIPILLTEFHYGALTHGASWGGLTWFLTQQQRANAFINRVNLLFATPQFTGYFFHTFADAPLSGINFEAENWYAAFVTTSDRPYPEMVNAAKSVNHSVYQVRGSRPFDRYNPDNPGDNASKGDVSLNGRVSLYDAVLAARYLRGMLNGMQLNSNQIFQADVDNDAIVEIADRDAIAQYAIHGTGLPNSCAGISTRNLSDHMKNEINTRISTFTSATKENGKLIWTQRGNNTGGWIRNTNAWINKGGTPLDLSGASPWNNDPMIETSTGRAQNPNGYRGAGTLITRKHVLFAAHYPVAVGKKIVFVNNNNQYFEYEIRAYKRIVRTPAADLIVSVLDRDVDSSITSYPILDTATLPNYLTSYQQIPILLLDQEDKALIKDTSSNVAISPNISLTASSDAKKVLFNETIIAGDSGNPGFVIINGKPVIVLTLEDVDVGPNLAYYKQTSLDATVKESIQDAINRLTPTPVYRLPKVDLSCFDGYVPSSSR